MLCSQKRHATGERAIPASRIQWDRRRSVFQRAVHHMDPFSHNLYVALTFLVPGNKIAHYNTMISSDTFILNLIGRIILQWWRTSSSLVSTPVLKMQWKKWRHFMRSSKQSRRNGKLRYTKLIKYIRTIDRMTYFILIPRLCKKRFTLSRMWCSWGT